MEGENTSGVITLDYVVNSVLNQLGDYTQRNYDRYLQFAIEGFGQLNMFYLPSVRVVHLQMNDALVVPLPPDCIDYTKIAVCINGKLWTLSVNNNMCIPRAEQCGIPIREIVSNPSALVSAPTDGYAFPGHYYNGIYYGGLYGIGGGFNTAYYRIDWERRLIIFSGQIPQNEVVLEYISTGVSKSGTTLIPYQALAPLKAYVQWQRIEFNDKITLGEKQRKETLFNQECMALQAFESKFTVDEYLDMCYRSSKQSPKR